MAFDWLRKIELVAFEDSNPPLNQRSHAANDHSATESPISYNIFYSRRNRKVDGNEMEAKQLKWQNPNPEPNTVPSVVFFRAQRRQRRRASKALILKP